MKSTVIFVLISFISLYSQFEIQNVGLKHKSITSLKFGYGLLAVGTDGYGVYWGGHETTSSFEWNHIPLDGKNVRTIYPHKSGPIGWAIGAGIRPEEGDTNFVYCSYMGENFRSISTGINRSATNEIISLDGFPDPSICGETFAAGGRTLYRRFFGDTIWYPVYNLTIEGHFNTIKAKDDFPTVLAGGGEGFANHLLIKSHDRGDSWDNISPLINVQSLDFIGDSAEVIFVTDIFRILKSEDYGNTWTEVFNTNSEFLISDLHYSKHYNLIFASGTTDWWDTGNGILYFNDIVSNQWIELQLNIKNPIIDIDDGPDDWIYIATPDSGVYRLKNLVVNVDFITDELHNDYKLLQNYPNPFNPTTTIKYVIPNDKKRNANFNLKSVHLSVFDILGRELSILQDKKQKPGQYEIEWNASDFPSGIYFYKLSVEDYSTVKKMVLLK